MIKKNASDIIGEYVQFQPHQNVEYSWINSLLGLGFGRYFHIILVMLMFILLYFMYGYIKEYYKSMLFESAALCIFAGTISSMIDKIFWNGSLDYILLKGLFIFDLKDVYISIFEVLLLMMVILNYKHIKALDEKNMWRDFIKFIRIKLKLK